MFRSSSPHLEKEHRELRECPVGSILRETPYIYSAIAASVYADNGSLNPLESPIWLQHAMRIVASERERLRELSNKDKATKSDSAAAGAALRRAHG